MPSRVGPVLIFLSCILSAYFALQIRMDNNPSILVDKTTEESHVYDEYVEEFGSEDFVVIAVSGKDLFDIDALDMMVDTLEALESIPQVGAVNGLPKVFRDIYEMEDPEALEEELTSTRFYEGLFLSPGHDVAGIIVELKENDSSDGGEEIVVAIKDAVVPLQEAGFRIDIVGELIYSRTIDAITINTSMRMFPIAAIASLVVLIWLLRSFTATVTVLLCGAVTLLLTFGVIGAAGRSLNLVTSALPLMLWVLALANSIHIVSRYQRHLAQTGDRASSISITMNTLRFSCIVSAITTAFGFLSLLVAALGPIRELGVYMAIGMILSLIVNLFLCPFLLWLLKVTAPDKAYERSSVTLDRVADGAARFPKPIVFVFAVLIIGGVYSTTQLETNPDNLAFLPKGSELLDSYEFVSDELTGLYTLEVAIETPGGWTNHEYWAALEELADGFEQAEVVARVYSPLDFVKKIHQWDHDFDPEYYALPESREQAEELLDLMNDEDREQIKRFYTEDGSKVRMSILITSTDSEDFKDVVLLGEELITKLPQPLNAVLTGNAVLTHAMRLSLVTTQFKSYTTAFILVFLSITIGLRSIQLTLLAVIPNVMPLLSVFTAMALLGIAIDAATVMVASISLGIAVDDTVHFLVGYDRHRRMGQKNYEAVRSTLTKVGPSLIVTTTTACIGFFTLSTSVFPPIASFGLLSGIAIVVALMADLLLLPAILAIASGTK